ncbi:ABC transporter permease [Planotetraspora kaengkrachanensis]|uniref:Transport permease protein n=1 Tax=Planotetraspora kaengkrachanensis TaxID=575193 RepID=A0A8J3PRQ8_9ACTN|nr:ABC transporter permease [Planotetraspora kaengkrachanensis]GIG77426.1 transport permease protein [Planotetraspora kaengkrachanensis]
MTALAALTGHYLRTSFANRFAIVFGAIQPLFYLVIFGPLFSRSGVGSWDTLVPGLLVQLALMSSGLVGFGVVFDQRFGVLERLRVTPAARSTLLLGRVLKDSVVLLIQAAGIIVLGYAFGMRAEPVGVVLGLLLITVLSIGMAALSYAAALTIRMELFAPVMSTLVIPLMLLSGALLPMSLAPAWLDVVSRFTPFRYAVEALRALFAGPPTSPTVLWGVLVTLVFVAVGFTIGTKVYQRENT